jgi:tetratricopeptide (TPR) repeat protein
MPRVTPMTPTEREAYARGCGCFASGNADEALETFSRLLESRSDFADVHYMVGVLRDRQGDDEGASQSLRRALRLNPSYAEALLALASVHERRGEFDRSREYAERASSASRRDGHALDPTTRGKLANLQAAVADAYVQVGEFREAIEGYRKALDHCPGFHDIRQRLGATLRDAGLPDKSLAEFQRVLRAKPELLDARIQLGLTYYTLGRAPDARREWQAVLSEDPSNQHARMYLRMVANPSAASDDR